MFFLIKNVLKPLTYIANNVKAISTSSTVLKAMSCVRVPTEGEPRKIKWYPYPVHDSRRLYFPRPNETKRITKHGWEARMATTSGKRVLMRRILKGRHALSH